MPPPTVAWHRGALVPFAEAGIALDDRGLLFGEAVYEVIPIVAGEPRLLPEHIARMRHGAEAVGIGEAGVPGPQKWASIASALVAAESVRDAVLYAQLTGGAGSRSHVPDPRPTPTFFAYLMPIEFPTVDDARRGIAVTTAVDPRWHRRDIKTTMLLPAVLEKARAIAAGADEVLLFGPDDRLHEGGSTWAGIVENGGVVAVPPSFELLPSVTGKLVADCCHATDIAYATAAIDRVRLAAADEVFVASTTRLIMPVVRIDDVAVGAGVGGPVTTRLFRALQNKLGLGE